MPYRYPLFNCSFCDKNEAEVKNLIAGPNVFICDICVGHCVDIITQQDFDRATRLEQKPTKNSK